MGDKVMSQVFEFEFGPYTQDDYYQILCKLERLSKQPTALGHFVNDYFADDLEIKKAIDRDTLVVHYPIINWEEIITAYPWARYLAQDTSGVLYIYEYMPELENDGAWYASGDMRQNFVQVMYDTQEWKDVIGTAPIFSYYDSNPLDVSFLPSKK